VTSVDVTSWEPADEEQLGTKPKHWLPAPTGELWLWKESTIHHDARHGSFRKGDDWSEVVAARVGRRLGVPVARVELATRGASFGVISRKVSDDEAEALVHGNELLDEIGVGTGAPHDRSGYSVDAVARALEGVGPPVASDELPTAFDWFAGYLVLDALVGNTDRHQDNWATIRSLAGDASRPASTTPRASAFRSVTKNDWTAWTDGATGRSPGTPLPLAPSSKEDPRRSTRR
jgi:hypothetical protein